MPRRRTNLLRHGHQVGDTEAFHESALHRGSNFVDLGGAVVLRVDDTAEWPLALGQGDHIPNRLGHFADIGARLRGGKAV